MVRRSAFRNIELDHGRIIQDTVSESAASLADPLPPLRVSTAS
jgi:hypothetical protein